MSIERSATLRSAKGSQHVEARNVDEVPRLTSDDLDIVGTDKLDSLLIGGGHDW